MHTFTLHVHHVMRVGHLASPMVWRSLLYPSPPLLGALRSSHFPCPMTFRHLPWLHPPRALLNVHAESSCPALPDLPGLGEAVTSGSQSPDWLASCHSETPARLAAHA